MEQSSGPTQTGRARRRKIPAPWHYAGTAQGAGVLAMVAVSPWLFGTTEDWAIQLMNGLGYGLGALLLLKKILGLVYRADLPPPAPRSASGRVISWCLNGLICLFLGYVLLSAINARATFIFEEQRLAFHDDFNPKLPHSYDSLATWASFWQYLAIALFFWSLRDWFQSDPRALRDTGHGPKLESLTPRLRLFLWVICINGSLIALQATLQRLSGSSNLLWLRESWGRNPITCFGPYSYRSNAAQYLNLIWPVTIGLWLTLRGEFKRKHLSARAGEGSHLVLVPLAAITALGPIISLSRGAAMIAGFLVLSVFALLLFSHKLGAGGRIATFTIFLIVIAFGAILAWPQLKSRFATLEKDQWARGEIYENAKVIAADFPLYGTGAGTFTSVYHLYRQTTKQRWHSVAHDDWLEARVTLGWVGFSIALSILLLSMLQFVLARGLPLPDLVAGTIVLALIGCSIHAKFDFPFQIYSILLLFVSWCAVLSVTSGEKE